MRLVPPIWTWDGDELFKVAVTFSCIGVLVAAPVVENILRDWIGRIDEWLREDERRD